jgi:nucleotide-binding universal stress UspA family protein
MGRIIACIDGSEYTKGVCDLSAWASKASNSNITLLHVVPPHCDMKEIKSDLSGSIGFGAKISLLQKLAAADEVHSKKEQRKGEVMIKNAKKHLANQDIDQAETIHRRGLLSDTISDLESETELVVMGRCGEDHQNSSDCLGSNLENIARSLHKPLLVARKDFYPIKKFLIACDGSQSANKAVNYAISNNLLDKNLECHLLKVGQESSSAKKSLKRVEGKLINAGFSVVSSIKSGESVEGVISDYIKEKHIDLLVIGSYGHSRIRNFIVGSITKSIVYKSTVPVLMFH